MLAVIVVVVMLVGRDPDVYSVSPGIVRAGDQVTVVGRFFGPGSGSLTLSGVRVPSTAISSWTETRIEFAVPRDASTGLFYVDTERGRSRGFLLRLSDDIPVAGISQAVPVINDVDDREPRVGSVVTITGRGFGDVRRSGYVNFPVTGNDVCHACTRDYAYGTWTDDEIEVRVPAGVEAGFLTVVTSWGESNPIRFEPVFPSGAIEIGPRSEIALMYDTFVESGALADSDDDRSVPDVTVEVQVPIVPATFAQREIRYLTPATSIARFSVTEDPVRETVRRTVVAYRYALASGVDETQVSGFYEDLTGFFERFTRAEPGLSVAEVDVGVLAAQARRGRGSPYAIARAAYDLTIDSLVPAPVPERQAPHEALASGFADDHAYAHLYVSVLRAALIPSRLVAGVIIADSVYPHVWSEFFVTGIGWIPVDPALGDEAFPAGFPAPEDPRSYYFGNLDNARLAFSTGTAPEREVSGSISIDVPADPFALSGAIASAGAAVPSLDADWTTPVLLSYVRGN